MINNRKDLKYYISQDAAACSRESVNARLFGDYTWKFQLLLRKTEYLKNRCSAAKGIKKLFFRSKFVVYKYFFNRKSLLLGYTIPLNVCESGLSLPHRGTIVISNHAHIGANCRIHEGVNIGSTNGSPNAPSIGNNVFIGTGAKIIGDISVADDVCIGANALVIKSINDAGTTWGCVPARQISSNNSHSNLSPALFK